MIINCDNEASQYILELCDNYLRSNWIKWSEVVNKIMQSLKVSEDKQKEPIEKK